MINTLRYRRFSATAWFWGMVLVVAPLFYVVIISLMSRGPYGGIVWNLTLDNYSRIFEPGVREILLMSLARSVGLAFLTTLFCVLVGFPLALFLVYRGGKWRSALFFLLIIPFWTNFLIRTYAWMVLLSDNGWLNHILEKLGMGPQALHLLFTPQAVLIGMLYNYLPSMTMSLYVSVEKMDPKLLDAAADLGAGPMKRFFKVIVPLCMPGLIAGSIMVFIPAMGEFVIPDILGGGTTLFVGNLLAQQFLVVRHWPYGAALSVILMAMVGICIWIFEKYSGSDSEDLLV